MIKDTTGIKLECFSTSYHPPPSKGKLAETRINVHTLQIMRVRKLRK